MEETGFDIWNRERELQPIVIDEGVAFADDEDTGVEGPARINIPISPPPQGGGANEEEVDDAMSHVMTVAQVITSPVAAEGADPSSLPDATTQVDLLDDIYVQPIQAEDANPCAFPDEEETVSDNRSWTGNRLVDPDEQVTEKIDRISDAHMQEIEASQTSAP